MTETKTALLITYGPVPTPQYQKIEGGGMRIWGLANGLKKHGFSVTVAVNNSFPQKHKNQDGISLINWSLDSEFKNIINKFDLVLISYCMGDASVFVANNILDGKTLVLDAYVPIYVEVSARNSDDLATEFHNYSKDIDKFNHVLKRGDYFLCANLPQKHMYTGVLASLGIINPLTYQDDRILVVPFGIESKKLDILKASDNPYLKLGVDKNDFVLLWFGGLYPWFNFEPLLNAIDELSTKRHFKFVLVGGKNPYNSHPDFVKQYNQVKAKLQSMKLLDKTVYLVDWVDFDERLKWYQGSDAVISINQTGDENEYSWRTRVIDYVWGDVPIITNGGDPLSNLLLDNHAAAKIDDEGKKIESVVADLIAEPKKLSEIKRNLHDIRQQFYWEKVVQEMVDALSKNPAPYTASKHTVEDWNLGSSSKRGNSLKTYAQKAMRKGLVRSAKFALNTSKDYLQTSMAKKTKPVVHRKAVFLSHPIDETGAPLVLLDIVSDFAKHYKPKDIVLVSPDIKKHIKDNLLVKGVNLRKMAMGVSENLIQAQLNINSDDYVLMNTVAIYENYKFYIYNMLESNKLKKAYWFIHEDNPKLHFKDKKEIARIKKLIKSGSLIIKVPSPETAKDYNSFFDTSKIQHVKLRVIVPKHLTEPRALSDFDNIKFITSGSPWDGRKGQFILLNALEYFETKLKKNNVQYRPFSVHLLAIGDDYISKQLDASGKAFFGGRYHSYKKVPREKALEITHGCNLTVCSSLNETFALFVAEGMAMGHPILRNESSGWSEQINDKLNGYKFDMLDIESLASKIELLLNTEATSNDDLKKMSEESQKIAHGYTLNNYYSQLS